MKAITWSVALLLTGCGAFEAAKDEKKKIDDRDSKLIHEWQTDCYENKDVDPSYVREEIKFKLNGDFDKVTVLHTDDQCKNEVLRYTVSGTYNEAGRVEDQPNVKKINLNVAKVFLMPQSDDEAKVLNDKKLCGKTDWTKDKAVEVQSLDCEGEDYKDGDVIFDIYEVDDNKLYLGKTFLFFDKSDADLRPTRVNARKPYTKK